MDIPSVGVAGAQTLTYGLPNEVLLIILRYLDHGDLIRVEQVCRQWKTVVEAHFATAKFLDFRSLDEIIHPTPNQPQNILDKYIRLFQGPSSKDVLEGLGRYGPSIHTLAVHLRRRYNNINWITEIADRFPNLITMDIAHFRITNDDFKYLSTKCCQLINVSLKYCNFTGEGLKYFLQALSGIKTLSIHADGEIVATLCHASAVFSTCRSLQTFEMSGLPINYTDTIDFIWFCKECVSLRKLDIRFTDMPNALFVRIGICSLLEELKLYGCPSVDNSTLIAISKGCPNLSKVYLASLQLVTDEGLKCFASCINLSLFVTHEVGKVTDETLVELSKCVNLTQVRLLYCPLVSDRGCAALVANCPRLVLLDVSGCKLVSNATVESAIEAVKRRNDGLVLHVKIKGTSIIVKSYENYHPLLRLITK